MCIARMAAGLAGMVLSANLLAAQQPGHPPQREECAMMGGPAMAGSRMRTMDSLEARLDTAVQRMNQATGDAKVERMADVINELVTRRRGMHGRMHGMAASRRKMPACRGAP